MTMTFKVASIDDAKDLVLLVNSAYRGASAQKGWTSETGCYTSSRERGMHNLTNSSSLLSI